MRHEMSRIGKRALTLVVSEEKEFPEIIYYGAGSIKIHITIDRVSYFVIVDSRHAVIVVAQRSAV